MDLTFISLTLLWLWLGGINAVVTPISAGGPSRRGPAGEPAGGPAGGPPDPLLEAPEGYMAFVEAPNAEPPKVARPPYVFVDVPCPGVAGPSGSKKTMNNLCGDLNKGVIPRNPMRPKINGASYPFELIKNKTLEFFSKALPILQADESLPKVAKSEEGAYYSNPNNNRLVGRSLTEPLPAASSSSRQGRKFCDNGGVMCMLYKAFQGESLGLSSLTGLGLTAAPSPGGGPSGPRPAGGPGGPERREDSSSGPWGHGGPGGPGGGSGGPGGPHMGHEGPPPTPCPARVEYSTPVFARNYQGVWRYVVQIPYEGYFTQTVEVTRCLQNKCHYMDGACLSSPRWLSMLVAELFYPDAVLPRDQNSAQYLHKRSARDAVHPAHAAHAAHTHSHASATSSNSTSRAATGNTHCDGVDEIGCFQVRLYYDWFLVPGSCKCWRPEYFSRFVRRKPPTDL